MALTKYKIGDLITVVDERNICGIRDFYGININKEFMPTVANTEGINETKYKVIRKGRFVFSGMQTGRDRCIRIGMYNEESPIIVSPAYTTFEVTATKIVLPIYFFMWFLSPEKDRLGWFYSDGSIRANLDWDRFCDIEMELPDISTQQKYVDIYNAMLENQKNYERGLEDLKLVCDGLLDKHKKTSPKRMVGTLLEESDIRNKDGVMASAHGINIFKQFMPSVASSEDLRNYKIVANGQLAYSAMQTGRDECIRIALNNTGAPIIVSPAYSVLQLKDNSVLSEYIMIWFSRQESDRLGWFMSDSSVRANLDLSRFYEVMIPTPDIKTQQAIVEIYKSYQLRKEINEKLKAQIKNICPILIRGSLKEEA